MCMGCSRIAGGLGGVIRYLYGVHCTLRVVNGYTLFGEVKNYIEKYYRKIIYNENIRKYMKMVATTYFFNISYP